MQRSISHGFRKWVVAFCSGFALICAGPAAMADESISGRVVTAAPTSDNGKGKKDRSYLSGVTVTLRTSQAGAPAAAVTGDDGKYRFKHVADGQYTLTPTKSGYVFTPASRSVTVADNHIRQQDFVATRTYSVSGRVVTTYGGASAPIPLAGATLILGGSASATTTTDADGNYSLPGLLTGSYTVAPQYAFNPTLAGSGTDSRAAFFPAARSLIINGADVSGQNFDGFNACAAQNGFCAGGSGSNCVSESIGACLDSDGDGLCDTWEIAGGVDLNGDGIIDAANDLLLPGADPHRKDLYLEFDYMEGPGHSHRPRPEAIQAVVDAFARQGIALHVDPEHDAIPETSVLTFNALDAVCSGLPPAAANFYDLKARYSDPKRKIAYHYAIFGHYNTCGSIDACGLCPPEGGLGIVFGTGGKAELPGNDFYITTGAIMDAGITPTVEQEAGLIMHELGHNFALRHAGTADLPEFKPNYLSAVNNNFTYAGIPLAAAPGSIVPKVCTINADCPQGICTSAGTCARIDYSRVTLATLNESSLDESTGIGAGTNDVTTYNCPDTTPVQGAASGPIDWNCNGGAMEVGVASDINADGVSSALAGFADWPKLLFKFQCTASGSANAPPPGSVLYHAGPSVEEARQRLALFPPLAARIELMQKTISLSASAVIPLAVFGAERFYVKEVVQASLKFAGAAPLWVQIADVNGDGREDLLLHFSSASLKLGPAAQKATLSGWLQSSQRFSGEVEVTVLP